MKKYLDKVQSGTKRFSSLFGFGAEQSRIKKKLILYFLLISIVSISVSFEIILEVSEYAFRHRLATAVESEFSRIVKEKYNIELKDELEAINYDKAFDTLDDLRVRMLLLMLVIIGTIITAFALFSKDIARPIDALVDGARKISEGDLTSEVPVLTQDEIGELAQLINDMNVNLQELIIEIRYEMERLGNKLGDLQEKNSVFDHNAAIDSALASKRLPVKALRQLMSNHAEMEKVLKDVKFDLESLTTLINMYKVYQVSHSNH